jgi:chromosome segregation ATPase
MGLQVTKLTASLEEQRSRVKKDGEEMNSKKVELNQMRSEEATLQDKLNCIKRDMESLSSSTGHMQLQISQVKALLVALEEYESQLKEGTKDLENAIQADDYHKLNTLLLRTITPPPEITGGFVSL